MRYRKLDENRDMSFGRSQVDFHRDSPEAVAQAAETRLNLWLGEWYRDLRDGTPWNTKVLGKYTLPTRDIVIRSRLLGTLGVSGLPAYDSQLNRDTRRFSVQATLDTVYGRAILTAPTPL